MKKTIRFFSTRAAMILLVTVLLTMTAQTAWADDPDLGFITATPTVDGGQTSNWGTPQKSENYDMLVDGNTSTKYGLSDNDPWVEFHYDNAITPKGYALWTEDSEGTRNPRSWTIKAKNSGDTDWTTLVTVDNTNGDKLPMTNNTRTIFALNNSTAYTHFRFEATRASNGAFQLAELQFCTVSPASFIQNAIVSNVKPTYFYSGSAISINPTVTAADGTVLTLGTHYTATLGSDNVTSFPFTVNAVGDYTLTITAKDGSGYTGSRAYNFSVTDCPEGLSIDTDYSKGQDGYYYVNMLGGLNRTKTITLPDGFTSSFKVYDDGGKSNNYSNGGNRSTLVLTAPAGYVLQLSGTVTTYGNYDCLEVHDGNSTSAQTLTTETSTSQNTPKDITTVISSGQSMTLYFYSPQTASAAGFDLTVRLIGNTVHNITVNTATGGSVTSDKTKAKPGETITLTVGTPTSGYMLSNVSVAYGSSENVPINWDGMNDNTITFTMPGGDVSVTPIFTTSLTAASGLFINMPATGNASYSIPSGVTSFKVYDNGGMNGNYSSNYNGSLTLTAPSNDYVLQVSGSVTTEKIDDHDYLIVYEGTSTSGTVLLPQTHSDMHGLEKTITPVVSSGQSVTLYFKTNDMVNFSGLDLTVTVGSTTASNTITVNTVTGGSITSIDKPSAKANETVTLTATPSDDYLLKEIVVSDGSSTYPVTNGNWHTSNTASFKMPITAVSVTPQFTNNLTVDGGLYINMPATGGKTVTIPSGVRSFKVYDDGGKDGNYSPNCNGTLTLTASAGYVLQLSGNVVTKSGATYVYLNVYDNSSATGTMLIDKAMSSYEGIATAITTVTSSGQSMTLQFISDNDIYTYAGLDLTVTLVPITYNITYNLNEGTNATGNPATYTVNTETFTIADPSKDGYTFAGWFSDAELNTPATTTITKGTTGDKTFWAKWIEDVHYGGVTIKDNGTTKSATLDASSEATIAITSGIEVNQVELNRTFTANQPATVMLPFSLGTGQTVNGGSFYKFSGVVKDGDIWKAQFTEAATLKANTPYLFNPSADGNMTFDLNNGTVTLNTTTAGESGNTTTNWKFHGTYQKVMWNGSTGGNTDPSDLSKTYGFAKGNSTTIAAGQFVHFAAGAWLKPMRCYLVYNGSTEGGTFQNARRMTRGTSASEELPQTITVVLLSSNGGTTSVGTINALTGEISFDGWYTMDGRKLDGKPTKKGLYINNGRKVVIK